jgi:hypothetical protein
MKRTVALTSVSVMLLAVCLWTLDTWARAGGGKSTGSRGSRSWSSPDSSPSSSSCMRSQGPLSRVRRHFILAFCHCFVHNSGILELRRHGYG